MPENFEPLILGVETATRAGSVALARGEQILGSTYGNVSASHSTDLIEMVESILHSSGATLSEIDLFAAATGPGSFTGLRIGLATIKSFAVCNGKKCAGVSTLAAIAHAAGTSALTVSLLPAGRGELFAQLFSVSDEEVREVDSASHLSPGAILEKYGAEPELRWAGEGAHLNADALRDWAGKRHITFNDADSSNPGWSLAARTDQLASSIAALALHNYREGITVGPNELRAVYVRASDAEINEQGLNQKVDLSVRKADE